MSESPTLKILLREGTALLRAAKIPAPHQTASLLVCGILKLDHTTLIAHPEYTVSAVDATRLRDAFSRRAQGEPAQYLIGLQEFYGLEFKVSPAVLIPRPETEFLVEVALEFCRHQNLTRPRIIDIGTGSGCLAVTLAVKLPAAQVLALDLSPDALAIARQNAVTHCVADRIQFLESNYLSAVRDLPPAERVDVVVTNPPYISQAEYADLQREVRDFEPKMALVGGEAGTEGYAQILADLDRVLKPDGLFACEVGYTQAQAVAQLGQQAGWDDQRIIDDLQGIPRVVVLRKQPL